MKVVKKIKRKVYGYIIGGYIAGIVTTELIPLFFSFMKNLFDF